MVGKGRNSASVRVDVLNKEATPYCEQNDYWPMTAPGLAAMLECPVDYSGGFASRLCVMIDAHSARWELPDYSNCLSDSLISATENVSSSSCW